MYIRKIATFLVLFAVITTSASADWSLDNSASTLDFMTTKNASKMEVQHFKKLDGGLMDDGQATLKIDLNSVETNIPVRNQRMQKMLFDTVDFPDAVVKLSVDPSSFTDLAAGESNVISTEAELSLHGVKQTISTELRVTSLENGLMVQNVHPILITADDFELGEGVEALKNIAKLASITTTVPVSFTLVFVE